MARCSRRSLSSTTRGIKRFCLDLEDCSGRTCTSSMEPSQRYGVENLLCMHGVHAICIQVLLQSVAI